MKRIRIGKDIHIKWSILTNGLEQSLDGRNLKLIVTSPYFNKTELKVSSIDNIIQAVYFGKDQKLSGKYTLTLWENYGLEGQTCVDECNAFELVNYTCQEGGTDNSLDTESVSLTGKLELITSNTLENYNLLSNKPKINNIELQGNKSLDELGIQGIINTENVSETTKELQPNKYYVFGEVAALTITLAEGKEGVLNEYMFEFTSGETATTLSLPETVKWMGDNAVEAGKTYQVSVVNNIAVMGGVS